MHIDGSVFDGSLARKTVYNKTNAEEHLYFI